MWFVMIAIIVTTYCDFVGVQAKSEVQKLIVKAQDGALEAQPGRTIMESFEGQVCLSTPSLLAACSWAICFCFCQAQRAAFLSIN